MVDLPYEEKPWATRFQEIIAKSNKSHFSRGSQNLKLSIVNSSSRNPLINSDCKSIDASGDTTEKLSIFRDINKIILNHLESNIDEIQDELCCTFNVTKKDANELTDMLYSREDSLRLFDESWTCHHIAMVLTYIDYSYLSKVNIGETFSEKYKERKMILSPNWNNWSN